MLKNFIDSIKRFLGIYSEEEIIINKLSHDLAVQLSKYVTRFLKYPPNKLVELFMVIQENLLDDKKGKLVKGKIKLLQTNLRGILYKQIFIKDNDITHNQAEILLLTQILDEFCDSLDELHYLNEDEIKILFMERHNEYQAIRKEMKKIISKNSRREAKQFLDLYYETQNK